MSNITNDQLNATELLTTEEAAALLNVSRRFLDKDRHTGRQNGTSPVIPYSVLGHRTVRYSRTDILTFLNTNRVG